MTSDSVCLTIGDVQSILQIGKSKAYELFRSRGFPSFRVLRNWRVRKCDFEQWIIKQIY